MKTDPKKVIVSIAEQEWLSSGLEYHIKYAIDEYIQMKHARTLQLFKQGEKNRARDELKEIAALMTFAVKYVEIP